MIDSYLMDNVNHSNKYSTVNLLLNKKKMEHIVTFLFIKIGIGATLPVCEAHIPQFFFYFNIQHTHKIIFSNCLQ